MSMSQQDWTRITVRQKCGRVENHHADIFYEASIAYPDGTFVSYGESPAKAVGHASQIARGYKYPGVRWCD